jgi:aspartate 1-decarboxylase
VTHSGLHYEGSWHVDEALLEAADIKEYEQIDICSVTNGERFSMRFVLNDHSIISVNGAATH